MPVTLDTSHFEMSPLKVAAFWNMKFVSVALDTSHFEMSALNPLEFKNIPLMSVTRDTSHSPMGPCGPVEQSPFEDSLKHSSTALWSSVVVCGANAGVGGVGGVA